MSILNVRIGEGTDFAPPVLRLGKKTDKMGIGQRKPLGYKPLERMARVSGSTKRGAEEKILRFMRVVIIQEYSDALGIPFQELEDLELDHIFGRNALGFEPFGSILNPRNMQLIAHEQHVEKTNAETKQGQRKDYRDKIIQGRLIELEKRLMKKVGKVFTLKDLKHAVESEIDGIW